MSFPRVYREIEEMVPRLALHTKTARAIARKAGLHSGEAVNRPATVIDVFVDPFQEAFARQHVVDFTNYTMIRMSSTSNLMVYLNRSLTGLTDTRIDPIDYIGMQIVEGNAFLGANRDSSSTGLGWKTLKAVNRVPLRVGLSTDLTLLSMDPRSLDGPFNVVVQVL